MAYKDSYKDIKFEDNTSNINTSEQQENGKAESTYILGQAFVDHIQEDNNDNLIRSPKKLKNI